ncbi:MAG TPA: HPr family phosphocarrier protein [Ktedonobacterales bacterium]
MLEATVMIAHPEGLHARPAAEFVKLANRYQASVRVRSNAREANGKSIISILGLGAKQGTQVTLLVEGDDAEQALHALEHFLTERSA